MKFVVLASLAAVSAVYLPKAEIVSDETANVISERYIVSLKKNALADMNTMMLEHSNWLESTLNDHPESSIDHHYNSDAFYGYAGTFDDAFLDKIASHPSVEYIERDQMVHLDYKREFKFSFEVEGDDIINPVVTPLFEKEGEEPIAHPSAVLTQTNTPSWGLARVSSIKKPTRFTNYTYPSTAGNGVTVYVIDTGVFVGHNEFEGRATFGANFITNEKAVDGNGHGTHCAGTIAGKTFGIAKKAKIVAVKVLSSSGSGTMSGVIAGVDFVVKQHLKQNGSTVASMVNENLKTNFSLWVVENLLLWTRLLTPLFPRVFTLL
jgi:cerevisin